MNTTKLSCLVSICESTDPTIDHFQIFLDRITTVHRSHIIAQKHCEHRPSSIMKFVDAIQDDLKTDVNWNRAGRLAAQGAKALPSASVQYVADKFPIVGWLPRYNYRLALALSPGDRRDRTNPECLRIDGSSTT
jgi:hypothetical protein